MTNLSSRNIKYISYLLITAICITQLSCANKSSIKNLNTKLDPSANLTYDQYKDKLLRSNKKISDVNLYNEDIENEIVPLPEISPIIAQPQTPKIGHEKLISITVTEDIPLKDVFIELSRLADVDMELDPQITGGVILKVKNKSLSEVVERICNLANLRFYNNNGVLKIEKDIAYLENYTVDFLNIVRSNSNTSQLSTSLASTGGSSSGSSSSSSGGSSSGSSNLGSTTALKSSYEGDLWLSIENDLNRILNISNASQSSTSSSSAPVSQSENYLSINKQASVVSIFATNKLHKQIKEYLMKIKSSISSQVLIEAKIVEVNLNDDYRTGINWSELNNKITSPLGLGFNFDPEFTDKNMIQFAKDIKGGKLTAITGALSGTNLQGVLQATQQFGSTRTLASPRIHAMNNQQAILSFVENKVYFTLDIQQADAVVNSGVTTPGKTTITSKLNSVPIGVIVSLQPSINLETNEITMNVRPTITASNASDDVSDPGLSFVVAQLKSSGVDTSGISSKVPTVNIKEIDSILKIKSGQIMVIGGMMEEISTNKDVGIPFLMSAPIVGNLFKSTSRTNNVVQTVIFIKATIMPTENIFSGDKDFYNSFARDKENTY